MQTQVNTPDASNTGPGKAVPALPSLYPVLKPRPEQSSNPDAQRQQEQARQQVQQ